MPHYEVEATHWVGKKVACEIYPDVFVLERGGLASPRSGLAQFGFPSTPMSEDERVTFTINELQLEDAIQWATSFHAPRPRWAR